MKSGSNLNMLGNTLKDFKIESLATDPTADLYLGSLSGAVYFNSTSAVYRFHNGTNWMSITDVYGTPGQINVTYTSGPGKATVSLDPNFANLLTTSYLPLSGGTLSGTVFGTNISANNISATSFRDSGFVGSRVLVSNGTQIDESSMTVTTLGYLSGVSANAQTQLTNLSATKTDKTITITAGAQLTGGGDLSTNRTISLATTGTAGTYDKVVTNAYGQVTSGRLMISADVPQLPATKIGSGNIDNTEFEYLNGVSANIQTQLNNMASTVGLTAYQLRSEKGTSLGYAAVDSNSKIYTSAIPDFILGQLKYGGSWNAATNTPTLATPSSVSGTFYIVNVSGTTKPTGLNPNTSASLWPSGTVEWKVGDWVVSDGTYWDKVDNTDAISSWNGRLGAIVPIAGDYTATQITNTASGGITATTVQAAINELDSEKLDKAGIRINAGAQLTGGGFVSASPTISLATTGTAGTYGLVVTNAYGQVTSGRAITSGDIPQLPATKIGSGNIDNTEFEYLNGVSANIQTQINDVYTDSSMVVIKNPALSQTISGQPLYIQRSSPSNDAFAFSVDGETQRRFLIPINGNLQWGDGTNARDTNLYRNGVNGLKTDDIFDAGRGLRATGFNAPDHNDLSGAGIEVHYTTGIGRVLSYDRTTSAYIPTRLDGSQLQFYTNGTVEAIIDDVGMYMPAHTASRVLVTNGSKYFTTSNITSAELNYLTGTSANIQTQINNVYTDSSMVVIKNPSSPQEISGAPIHILRDSTTSPVFASRTASDTLLRYYITADGKIAWGDGTNARDTTLYRNGVNGLKTDDVFEASYGVRATNYNSAHLNALGGAGVEVVYNIGQNYGRLVTYDRDTSAYLPTRIDGSQLQFYTSGTVEAIIDDVGMYMPAHTASRVLVTNGSKYFTTSNITSAELNYLTGTSANIQNQLDGLKVGTYTRFSSAINIVYGTQAFTVNHNLGYLRPTVKIYDEAADEEILVTPIFISTTQLSIPITSSQVITGARLEVYI